MLTGHGGDAGEREEAEAVGGDGFQALMIDSIAEAKGVLPLLGD